MSLSVFKRALLVISLPLALYGSDMDSDLVPDRQDLCPNTPEGVFVDNMGCTKTIEKTVYFEHASWTLDIKAVETVDSIIAIAKELQGYKIYIQGHTDATADSKTNLYYSKQRASNVFNLIAKEVDKKRMVVSWYGESQPIASNTTDEGQKSNRRVSIILK